MGCPKIISVQLCSFLKGRPNQKHRDKNRRQKESYG